MKTLTKYSLEISTFVAGAVVMIYELVAARILAPYVGTSTLVWTSVIGVFLLALSTGYYLGGRLADALATKKILALLLLFSGLSIAISRALTLLLPLSYLLEIDLRLKAVLLALLLFGLPTLFLGMVSPYVAKLRLNTMTTSGKTIGNLYALSTIGSLLGTFLGGFILISYFSLSTILGLLVIALFVVALLVTTKTSPKEAMNILFIVIASTLLLAMPLLATGSVNIIADINTTYSRFLVRQEQRNGEPVRLLVSDASGIQSGIKLSDPNKLLFDYLQIFAKATTTLLPNQPTNNLLIGGGALTYPRYFVTNWPNASITVVEIDPTLTEIAKEYFYFQDHPRIEIINEDGRTALTKFKSKTFDIIYLDAYSSGITIPFHLTTQEMMREVQRVLVPDGQVLINIIGTLHPDTNRYVASMIKTFQSVFTDVAWQPTHPDQPYARQNIILLASNTPFTDETLPEGFMLAEELVHDSNNPPMILTDNFAPIELLTYHN